MPFRSQQLFMKRVCHFLNTFLSGSFWVQPPTTALRAQSRKKEPRINEMKREGVYVGWEVRQQFHSLPQQTSSLLPCFLCLMFTASMIRVWKFFPGLSPLKGFWVVVWWGCDRFFGILATGEVVLLCVVQEPSADFRHAWLSKHYLCHRVIITHKKLINIHNFKRHKNCML